MQYAFTILAVINLISTSLELGTKTVLSWRCSVSWLPLMWAMTPIACHAPAVLSLEVYRRKVRSQWSKGDSKNLTLFGAMESEFTISAHNTNIMPIVEASEEVHPGAWSIALQSVASLFGILQVIFGMAVLSSLLYIGVEDATILLLRYATSAFICKSVMFLELEGMISAARWQEMDGIA
jgi:hypothetical protein